jgi:hypothetical protein
MKPIVSQLFLSKYIYIVYKSLRIISIVCFLSLMSNLVGNLVWTYLEHKESISLSSEEDDSEERDSDTEENNSSTKRGVNLLEEELHLAEYTHLLVADCDYKPMAKSTFSIITDKTIGSDKLPLDNPPEVIHEFS